MSLLRQQLEDSVSLVERNALLDRNNATCALIDEIAEFFQDGQDRLRCALQACARDDKLHLVYGQAQVYALLKALGYERDKWEEQACNLIRESARA